LFFHFGAINSVEFVLTLTEVRLWCQLCDAVQTNQEYGSISSATGT